jgi:uncharacterized ion transporter superfamily protein YfcC
VPIANVALLANALLAMTKAGATVAVVVPTATVVLTANALSHVAALNWATFHFAPTLINIDFALFKPSKYIL